MSGLSPDDSGRLPRDDCLILSPVNMFGTKEALDAEVDPWRSAKIMYRQSKRLMRFLWGGNPSRHAPTVTVILRSVDLDWIHGLVNHIATSYSKDFRDEIEIKVRVVHLYKVTPQGQWHNLLYRLMHYCVDVSKINQLAPRHNINS